MNLILFESAEAIQSIPRDDPRAVHILSVLQRREGDSLDVGVVNGSRGRAIVDTILPDALRLRFSWHAQPPPIRPSIHLIIGLPRPQTARKILHEATTLGACSIAFVHTEKSDANYAQSTLWSSGEWRRHLIAGAEQAFDTRIPEISWSQTLESALDAFATSDVRLALDNYEASARLNPSFVTATAENVLLAFGPERGWGPQDRSTLRKRGFQLVHLGSRVLRSETAVVAAIAICQAASTPSAATN